MRRFLLVGLLLGCGRSAPSVEEVEDEEPLQLAPQAELEAQSPPTVAPTETPPEPKYAASHVLVAWSGAVGASASTTRDQVAARRLADQIRDLALAGAPFDELAERYSDGPSARRGGRLGVYRTGTMVPAFEAAVAAVEVGEVGPVVETPFGYHVVRRDPVEEIRASHLVVAWEGAERAGATRSKAEARAVAAAALKRLEAGEDFAAVAREVSEDATAPLGGDLGPIARGQLVPAFEDVAFELEPGEHSAIVETPYGFHVVLRTE